MMNKITDYFYIFATIGFTVYGQLILKWRASLYGQMPLQLTEKIKFILHILFDPWVFSGLCAAFLASFSWIAAITKFELTYAYPFTSLSFVLVLVLGGWLLSEQMTLQKIVGIMFIMLGTWVVARG